MKNRVFISDLHLAAERPEAIELFLRFIDDVATKADELYILGDFLEYWLGDDDPSPSLTPVFNKLTALNTEYGTSIYLMHGNRDFLIGNELAERCHFKIIDDPYKLTLQNHEALLMHGDTLCTDDIEYQNFRQMVRNSNWKKQILSKSIEERIQIAENLRQQSMESNAEKEAEIMDVNQQETEKTFIDNNITLIIHGHTHRPAIHHKSINGSEATRVVLGDWHETGSYLQVKDFSDLKLETYR